MRDNLWAVRQRHRLGRTDRRRIGKNIRQLRLGRGWSQEKLAELVWTSGKYIGLVELGKVNVSIDVLSTMALKLSVDLADLIGPTSSDSKQQHVYAMTQRDLGYVERALEVIARAKRMRSRRRSAEPD